MRDARLARVLLVALSLMPASLLADSAWTVPGIVNAAGLNGTHFVSDLTVTNPGGAPANVTLSFFPGSSSPKNLTLNPGQTVVYSDVAGVTFGVSSAAGALSISSDQPLLIRAKTYNTAASGTYGVSLPVVGSGRLLSPGDVGDSLWITQDASGAASFRTNIAVVFPDDTGGEATVIVYDADGNEVGSQDFSLDSAGLQQFSVGTFAGSLSVGRAQIAVTRGHAAGYAVVVDNVTGDSSLFAFEDLPAGIQDVLVNGVARASGRNGAFFRTDGRFYNPTDTDATVTVAFHASGNANPAPATASFVVPAGKIRDVVDVLASLLGLPVGSAGALRFQSNWPVAILCRTSNVDPSGARPGTFGSQQKPVPLLSFVTSADAGAAVTGIRQDAAFRTNVGFAAGADGAQYMLTLADASGATVATTSASLGVFGWTQPLIQDLFPNSTIPENATLRMKVTGGSVDVFDSSIDNLSGDPVVTPIASLPVVIPSSATIGPAGGSIRSDDGRLRLRVPAGALGQPVAISFQPGTNDAALSVGPGYQLLPASTTFSKPALMTLAYSRDDVEGSQADALSLVVNGGSGWVVVGGGSTDTLRRTVTVPIFSATPSPQTSERAGRRTLDAPGSTTWGQATSWMMTPHGKFALLVGGKASFVVESTGPSSSTSPSTFVLSRSPSQVSVSWFVNNQNGGNIIDGTITPEGILGVYQAGTCPPPRNPVTISAHISNGGPFSLPYYLATYARVRILPRKWDFSVNLSVHFACPFALVADHAVYDAGFSFSLSDDLNIDAASVVPHPPVTKYDAASIPNGCEEGDVNFSHTGGDSLSFDLDSGAYVADVDGAVSLDTIMTIGMPTLIGYNYVHIIPGVGQQAMHQDARIVPVPNVPYTLLQGRNLYPVPLAFTGFTALWTFDLEPICP